ncbi:ROK family protein [Fictibacillus phosphorivorans]|uniref:ROK family protein n=1 Tax=Fictibacillus phosphorivorans TaxID=1221500 RepID=UPI00203E0FC9|nr:ROK family protein [Fictibacillus phosphorivorans]MCM3718474.1 ROK family protein [Fictibacillus phosphorivorans]MCM3776170.1 ROK family protein [Fictibacillus phosphorivorans]
MKKRYLFAADVGGTTIECGLFSTDGELLNSKTLITSEVILSDVAECLAEEMKKRMSEQGITIEEVYGIGLGVPGLVDSETGMVLKAPSLKWNRYPLGEKLHQLLGIPVFVGNDVNTGLLGEVEKGSLQHVKHALYFMIGTSIGSGLLMNGEIYPGSQFSAGEVGYMITDHNVLEDGFVPARPGYGYLSTQAGGFGLAVKYEKETGKSVTTKQLFKLAETGDQTARKIIDHALRHLTASFINAAVILNPEVILLGGGVGNELAPYLHQIDENLEKYLPVKPELRISTMQNRSVLYGAYALCSKHVKDQLNR